MSRPTQFPALTFSPVLFQPIPNIPNPTSESGPSRPRTPRFEIVIPTRQPPRLHSPKPLHKASNLDPPNVSGNLTEEGEPMLNNPEWEVLQAIPCKWQKCDAVLANITIAAKHYAKHMALLMNSTGTCGLRRCFHPVNTTSKRKIEQHYFEHHIEPRDPDVNVLHTTRPRPPTQTQPSRHLPVDEPSYLLSVPPVVAHLRESPSAVDMRRKRSRDSSVTAIEPIRFNYGDAPFIPMQGDAIVEVRRHSSYLFPHPAAYSTDPTERALIQQLSLTIPNHDPETTSSRFDFPMIETSDCVDASNAASAVTSTVTFITPENPTVSPPTIITDKTLDVHLVRVRAPFQVIRPTYTGRLPMTIPLADVYANVAKRKKEKGKGRALGERASDESNRSDKIRRIAEKVAYETVGRTIGVDWWEVVTEVQTALEETEKPVEDDQAPGPIEVDMEVVPSES